ESSQRVDIIYKPWLLIPKHSFQLNWKQRLKPVTGRFRVGARNDVNRDVEWRQLGPGRRHLGMVCCF
ncbi:MAG TPA: hypothetical protein VKA34_20230, partial [Balneolales bacterium]|nr:hypothetical protein [Balneolales bacterium]